MNASAGSFKGGKSSKDIRTEAKQDLDTLSSVAKGSKKNLPKTLKPLQESKADNTMASSRSTQSMRATTNAVGQKVYTLAVANVKQNGVGMLANKRR